MNLLKRARYRRIIVDLRIAILLPYFTPRAMFLCRHHGPRIALYEVEERFLQVSSDHPERQACPRCVVPDLKKSLARCPRCRRYSIPMRLLNAPFVKVSDLWELSPEQNTRIIAEEHSCDPRDYTTY